MTKFRASFLICCEEYFISKVRKDSLLDLLSFRTKDILDLESPSLPHIKLIILEKKDKKKLKVERI